MYEKLIQTGDYIEHFVFEKTPLIIKRRRNKEHHVRLHDRRYSQFLKRSTKQKKSTKKSTPKRRRQDNLHRATKQFNRIVQSNVSEQNPPLLLSATFARCKDLEFATKEWKKFIRKTKAHFGIDVPYIAVTEFQKRGDIHFHALIFAPLLLEYGDTIKDTYKLPNGRTGYNYRTRTPGRERTDRTLSLLWGNGFIDCLKTDGGPGLSYYLSKYFAKAFNDNRMRGKKLYTTSKNIERPRTLSGTKAVHLAIETLEINKNPIVFKDTFDTLWLGKCSYKKIKFNDN